MLEVILFVGLYSSKPDYKSLRSKERTKQSARYCELQFVTVKLNLVLFEKVIIRLFDTDIADCGPLII